MVSGDREVGYGFTVVAVPGAVGGVVDAVGEDPFVEDLLEVAADAGGVESFVDSGDACLLRADDVVDEVGADRAAVLFVDVEGPEVGLDVVGPGAGPCGEVVVGEAGESGDGVGRAVELHGEFAVAFFDPEGFGAVVVPLDHVAEFVGRDGDAVVG